MNVKDMTPKEIDELIIESLEALDLSKLSGQKEWLEYQAQFRTNGLSLSNQMLLNIQAKELKLKPVFGTFKDFKKMGYSVLKGATALSIRTPIKTKSYYTVEETDGIENTNLLLTTLPKDVLEKKIASKEIIQKDIVRFRVSNMHFSLSQTNIPESERPEFIQRYNPEATAEDNKELYNKMKLMFKSLGIDYKENNIPNESLGYLERNYSKDYSSITVESSLPQEAKIAVMSHEFGHYLLHREQEIRESLEGLDREVQAELFSLMMMGRHGITSNADHSLKYIKGWHDSREINNSLGDVDSKVLLTHMKIVESAVNLTTNALSYDVLNNQMVTDINSYKPHLFNYDVTKQEPSIIYNGNIKSINKQIEVELENE